MIIAQLDSKRSAISCQRSAISNQLRERFIIQDNTADRKETSTTLTAELESLTKRFTNLTKRFTNPTKRFANLTKGFTNLTVRFARLTVISPECFPRNDL